MAQSNQNKKSKINKSKESDPSEPELISPLTPQQIALITASEPQPKQPEKEHNIITNELLHQFLHLLIEKFEQFVEEYGGYYTRAGAMKALGINSKNTFNIWLKEKGLPYYEIDTKIYIKKTDLEKFLKPYKKVIAISIFYLSGFWDAVMMAVAV